MATAAATDPDLVDAVENGRASLVSPTGDQRTVALADLPAGAREGAFVANGQVAAPPADEGAAIRARLGAGDPGGTISLDDAGTAQSGAPGAGVDAISGGSPTGTPPAAPPAPGSADAYIDGVIGGSAEPSMAAPGSAAPPIPPTGPDGLPADSQDIQKRIEQGTAAEGKALDEIHGAKETGADAVQKAQDDRQELARQQAADLAAQQLYVRDRQAALDKEDADNLAKARDQVIPDFWESREGDLVGAAITAALSGAAAGLLGSTHNAALEAIQHNVDGYFTRERQRIDGLYKYAEQKGLLNDKTRAQYAGELTDLMQNHAYAMQAAADRVQEVSDQAKGLVDQKQVDLLKAQLSGRSATELQAARKIDIDRYDAQTKREIADADTIKANAAMAKAHKGKGGGGGAAAGEDWLVAMQKAAQEPGATSASVSAAALAAGYRGKTDKLNTMAGREVQNVKGQVGDVSKQMDKIQSELEGTNGKGPASQYSRIRAMTGELSKAMASGNSDDVKARVTGLIEEAGGMLSGGKTTKNTVALLEGLKSLGDEAKNKWSHITGSPTEGAGFVNRLQNLFNGVAGEKKSEISDIRDRAVTQTLGNDVGTATSKAARRHVMGRISGLFNQTDESGKPVFTNTEGGAKVSATVSHVEGAQSKTATGIPIVFRGGKWVRQ